MTDDRKKPDDHISILDYIVKKLRPEALNVVASGLKPDVDIRDPIRYTRVYHVTLPICREGKMSYITYHCKLNIDDSYLCRHANMEINNDTFYQSRDWNRQSCKITVAMTSLQGFFQDAFYEDKGRKKQNIYAPVNHESLIYMFDPVVLKSFPSVVFMQINNTYIHDTKTTSMEESMTKTTTHTILFGYIKDFKIILSHNPRLVFTIQDCLQHTANDYAPIYYKVNQ